MPTIKNVHATAMKTVTSLHTPYILQHGAEKQGKTENQPMVDQEAVQKMLPHTIEHFTTMNGNNLMMAMGCMMLAQAAATNISIEGTL